MKPAKHYLSLFPMAGVACGLMALATPGPMKDSDYPRNEKVERLVETSEKSCDDQTINPEKTPRPGGLELYRKMIGQSEAQFYDTNWRSHLVRVLNPLNDGELAVLEQKRAVLCVDPRLLTQDWFGFFDPRGVMWPGRGKNYISLTYHPFPSLSSDVLRAAVQGFETGKFEAGKVYEGRQEGNASTYGKWVEAERPETTIAERNLLDRPYVR